MSDDEQETKVSDCRGAYCIFDNESEHSAACVRPFIQSILADVHLVAAAQARIEAGLSAIAHPLAGEKLTKKCLKLVKKGMPRVLNCCFLLDERAQTVSLAQCSIQKQGRPSWREGVR